MHCELERAAPMGRAAAATARFFEVRGRIANAPSDQRELALRRLLKNRLGRFGGAQRWQAFEQFVGGAA